MVTIIYHFMGSYYNCWYQLKQSSRPTLHSLTQILAQNLTSLSTQMQTNSPLLASTAIYPVPLYPGREKEGILNQLLRKKLEPGVEEWVEQGQKIAEEVVGDDAAEWKDLWEWAAVNGNELARSHDWGGDDEDEDEDEDEDDSGKGGVKMEGVEKNGKKIDVKPMDMHDVLQFLSKGQDSKG